MKRLALYVFWEKNGIVYNYVEYYLQSLTSIAQEIVVIVNGRLSSEGRRKLEELGVVILVRENKGLDFSAWKAALEYKGWELVTQYDELILCNCSCYGPLYPFSELFDVMAKRNCDFWGINRQPKIPGKMLGHIQSYFYVFRNPVLSSACFRQWWDNLVSARSYKEEVWEHEMQFSTYLEKNGYRSDTYMDYDKYLLLSPTGGFDKHLADFQLIFGRNPLLKRRTILEKALKSLKVLELIDKLTSYPVDYIYADMARNIPHSLPALWRMWMAACFCSGRARQTRLVFAKKIMLLRKWTKDKRI